MRGPTAASAAAGSRSPRSSTSATTGVIPAHTTDCHVARYVKPGTITSAPGSRMAHSAAMSPSEQFETAVTFPSPTHGTRAVSKRSM